MSNLVWSTHLEIPNREKGGIERKGNFINYNFILPWDLWFSLDRWWDVACTLFDAWLHCAEMHMLRGVLSKLLRSCISIIHRYRIHFTISVTKFSDWEGKGPCAIVPLTSKMAHKSLCRMIRNGPLKISKSLKKAENGPFGKNLFPITVNLHYFGS